MEILTNNDELFKQFSNFFYEILNDKNNKVSEVNGKIKSRMMEFGSKIFESWLTENIGSGYQGCKINKVIDGKQQTLKFYKKLEKNICIMPG